MDMKQRYWIIWLFLGGLVWGGCQRDINEPEPAPEAINPIDSVSLAVISDWVHQQEELFDQTPALVAPITARTMAYTYLALYEALVPAMPGFQSLATQLNGMPAMPTIESGRVYHWGTVANVAQYAVLAEVFVPANVASKQPLDSLRRKYEQAFAQKIPADVMERSIRFGAAIGGAIWQFARQDGGNSASMNLFPTSFSPTTGQAFWRSTTTQPRALLPQWRDVRPLVAATNAIAISAPPTFSSRRDSPFFAEAKGVYDRSLTLSTPQQQNISRWAEEAGSRAHPLHLVKAFIETSRSRNIKTSQVLIGLVRLAIAGHDAYIQSWKAKYQFQRIRPQTYLQETLDPTWRSRVLDNNTPEYGSSWVTYSSAWIEVVKATIGSAGTFSLGEGASYTDLNVMQQDIAAAQLDAGLHFPSSVTASQTQGSAIGRKINELAFRKP